MAQELDLTNAHLHNLANVDIHEGLTVSTSSAVISTRDLAMLISPLAQAVDLTANRLKDIDPRLLALKGKPRDTPLRPLACQCAAIARARHATLACMPSEPQPAAG